MCSAAFAQCEPRWSDQFQSAYLSGPILCAASYDVDGPGGMPAHLIAGGSFRRADAGFTSSAVTPLNGIAYWDGASWNPFGKGLAAGQSPYTGARVRALAVLDEDGNGPSPPFLYAAGDLSAPGITETVIARWNGTQWEAMSRGQLGGDIFFMTVVDEDGVGGSPPSLYVAGHLSVREGASVTYQASGLACFDGSNWRRVKGILRNAVTGMASLDDDGDGPHQSTLHVAATFDAGRPNERNEILRWDGEDWYLIAPGPPVHPYRTVDCLAYFDEDGAGPNGPSLFAGGDFTNIGDITTPGIARWTGQAWERVGLEGVVAGAFMHLVIMDEDGHGPMGATLLSVCANGNGIARWDGLVWSPVGTGVFVGTTFATFLDDESGTNQTRLVVGGSVASGPNSTVGSIVQWDGQEWMPLLGNGLAGIGETYIAGGWPISTCFHVSSPHLTQTDHQDLIVGGYFLAAGNVVTNAIARWDGRSWLKLGDFYHGQLSALAFYQDSVQGVSEPELVAAGYSDYYALGSTIATWRNENWEPIGVVSHAQLAGVSSMVSFDTDADGPQHSMLIVSGKFASIDGRPAENIAQWDGNHWSAIKSPHGYFSKLSIFDEDGDGPATACLFASFDPFPDDTSGLRGLVRWDRESWSAVGSLPVDYVSDMTVGDLDGDGPEQACLFVVADFLEPGAIHWRKMLGKWNGISWTLAPIPNNDFGGPYEIACMDEDGGGPELAKIFVCGNIQFPGSNQFSMMAAWDGSSWKAVHGNAVAMWLSDVTVYDEDGSGPKPPSLIIGGEVTVAGDVTSSGLARWGRLAPTILVQPKNCTIDPLSPVTFTVRVGAGNANSYQWRKNGRPLRDDAHIAGVHTDTLRITSVKDFDEGSYDVVVTNDCGTSESLQAQLTVRGGRPTVSRLHQ